MIEQEQFHLYSSIDQLRSAFSDSSMLDQEDLDFLAKNPLREPSGECYKGIKGGHQIKVTKDGINYILKTSTGVRGRNIPCTVCFDNNEWFVPNTRTAIIEVIENCSPT